MTDSSFQAAFDTLRDLQKTQYETLRRDVVEVKNVVKRIEVRQDGMDIRQDQMEDALRLFTELLAFFKNKRTVGLFGSAMGGVVFVATWLARIF